MELRVFQSSAVAVPGLVICDMQEDAAGCRRHNEFLKNEQSKVWICLD